MISLSPIKPQNSQVEQWLAQGNQITVLASPSTHHVVSKKVVKPSQQPKNKPAALVLDGVDDNIVEKIQHYLSLCKKQDRDYDFGMYIGFLHGLEYSGLIGYKHLDIAMQWYLQGVK
ncbi:hypothetical protein [Moraxella sp. ZY210820]|uniref:hypothetical protein n=1 Tax=unclassified Moraxella TaxID=2685852 RepID=UPI00272EF03A|nr:hypothetical protein [Moraxella sp. ZY210820]WLF84505.1 hypothetical protein LU301_03245 [Moraxella sp. ZY210820]